MELRTAAKLADADAVAAESTPSTNQHLKEEEEAEEETEEETEADMRRQRQLRTKERTIPGQIREDDDQVGLFHRDVLYSKHLWKLPTHQEYPQARALRKLRAQEAPTEGEDGCAEQAQGRDRQAPPPDEEDGDAVRRGGALHPTPVCKQHSRLVGALCQRAKRSNAGQFNLVSILQCMLL